MGSDACGDVAPPGRRFYPSSSLSVSAEVPPAPVDTCFSPGIPAGYFTGHVLELITMQANRWNLGRVYCEQWSVGIDGNPRSSLHITASSAGAV